MSALRRPDPVAELRAAPPPLEEPSITMLAAMILELREDNISMREDIS